MGHFSVLVHCNTHITIHVHTVLAVSLQYTALVVDPEMDTMDTRLCSTGPVHSAGNIPRVQVFTYQSNWTVAMPSKAL